MLWSRHQPQIQLQQQIWNMTVTMCPCILHVQKACHIHKRCRLHVLTNTIWHPDPFFTRPTGAHQRVCFWFIIEVLSLWTADFTAKTTPWSFCAIFGSTCWGLKRPALARFSCWSKLYVLHKKSLSFSVHMKCTKTVKFKLQIFQTLNKRWVSSYYSKVSSTWTVITLFTSKLEVDLRSLGVFFLYNLII